MIRSETLAGQSKLTIHNTYFQHCAVTSPRATYPINRLRSYSLMYMQFPTVINSTNTTQMSDTQGTYDLGGGRRGGVSGQGGTTGSK